MMDIETTSNNQFDTMLLQIAMVAFDYETGETVDTFNAIIDTDFYPKMTFNTSTLKFWLENADVLFDLLTKNEESEAMYVSEPAMVRHAVHWINQLKEEYRGVYLWGNGENFDNTIFHHKCNEFNLPYPIDYNKDLDVRTHMKHSLLYLAKNHQTSKILV